MYPISHLVCEAMKERQKDKRDVVSGMGYRNDSRGLRRLNVFLNEVNVPDAAFLLGIRQVLEIPAEKWQSAWEETLAALILEQDARFEAEDSARQKDFQPHLWLQFEHDSSMGFVGHLGVANHRVLNLPDAVSTVGWDALIVAVQAVLRDCQASRDSSHDAAEGRVAGAILRPHYRSHRFQVDAAGGFLHVLAPSSETRQPDHFFASGSKTQPLKTLRSWIQQSMNS